MSTISLGHVKWFNNAKGYGFIIADNRSEDMFAHYSAIIMDGYKTLKAGQRVSFEISKGPKGYHAIGIRPLDMLEECSSLPADAAPDLPPARPEMAKTHEHHDTASQRSLESMAVE